MTNPKPIALTLALAAAAACQPAQHRPSVAIAREPASTSVFGHWVLSPPLDSTAFAGASQVELLLAPGSFTLSATYPARAPLTIEGRADLGENNRLTLVPASASGNASAVGFPVGQPFTRVATASGTTLVLAPPSARVPVPSSVWYRLDAARVAGIAR